MLNCLIQSFINIVYANLEIIKYIYLSLSLSLYIYIYKKFIKYIIIDLCHFTTWFTTVFSSSSLFFSLNIYQFNKMDV